MNRAVAVVTGALLLCQWGVAAIGMQAPIVVHGTWERVVDAAAFSPRDSSANAAVYYRGAHWVFAGWSAAGEQYESTAAVWRSADGVVWTLVNATPPYHPYSAFVVFRGKVWAMSSRTYRSTDGVHWQRSAQLPFVPIRATVHGKALMAVDEEQRIWMSLDGERWRMLSHAPWSARELPGFHSFSGRLWFFGGSAGYNTRGQESYFRDVWSSADGVEWRLESAEAPWEGRHWAATAVYGGRLWLASGWRFDDNFAEREWGNRRDVWSSADGRNWDFEGDAPWSARHAPLFWTAPDGLWLSSGYAGGGRNRLYNDVWRLRLSVGRRP